MSETPGGYRYHLRVRLEPDQGAAVRHLARQQRVSLSQLVRTALERELADAESTTGSLPDESAVREMAILVAVELVLKLQEATIPGAVTLSRTLLEEAARAAIVRIELVESRLREGLGQ